MSAWSLTLGYDLYNLNYELYHVINQFSANVIFTYPLITSRKQKFSRNQYEIRKFTDIFFWKIGQKHLLQFSHLFFFYTKKTHFSKAITWIHCFEPFQHRISFLFEFPYFHSFDQTLEKIEKENKIYWAFLALTTLLCFCNSTASRYFVSQVKDLVLQF